VEETNAMLKNQCVDPYGIFVVNSTNSGGSLGMQIGRCAREEGEAAFSAT
jgi:hypothetical protein